MIKAFRKPGLIACLAMLPAVSTLAEENFSYSYFEFATGRVTLDDAVELDSREFSDLGALRLSAAHHFGENFAVGGDWRIATRERGPEEITRVRSSLEAIFPVALTDRLDLVPRTGFTRVRLEDCVDDSCKRDTASGLHAGLGLRVWAVEDSLEVFTNWRGNRMDEDESSLSLGAGFWWLDHHRLSLDVEGTDSQRAVLLGYRFSWQ